MEQMETDTKIDFEIMQNHNGGGENEEKRADIQGFYKNENLNKQKSVLFYKEGKVCLWGFCILYP